MTEEQWRLSRKGANPTSGYASGTVPWKGCPGQLLSPIEVLVMAEPWNPASRLTANLSHVLSSPSFYMRGQQQVSWCFPGPGCLRTGELFLVDPTSSDLERAPLVSSLCFIP